MLVRVLSYRVNRDGDSASCVTVLCFCVTGDASSAPCPAQSNFPPGRSSGCTGGAGASTCSQPAAVPPVLAATEPKLTPGRQSEE